MLPIVQAPNTVLSQKARPIKKFDATLQLLIKEMTYTLEHTTDPEGVGLAAPQVGESQQLFIVKEDTHAPLYVFINPKILSLTNADQNPPPLKASEGHNADKHRYTLPHKSVSRSAVNGNPERSEKKANKKKDKEVKLEGCLSLKDIWGIVHRADSVTLAYQDEHGKHHEKTFTGFLATIVQHECDHLNGILFPKRVLEQQGKLYKSTEDEDGETVFEELSI